ncbi:chlorophyll synthesis pathway protein BchC [Methylocapsa palsarum]|uniref:3-hydroxyethyl bacteriochlorophyllide a dehydrogenase n=1 Tax=Methylocapsa palsarum TaxID=1612308 RepID=A0A1I4BDP9_9HYPH|nr:chlorophyll synthesis pathway protein BchC [Methylocapsa palsarum]SFK66267.1 3-hydroxyethyl bacteriochlorophyllide a dehydrogenase [Methylocapsa palsarum]
MDALAVVLEKPERLAINRLDLVAPGADDVVVDVEWSGVSAGTERLLWSGRMPHFPGMGYPLVPGYEAVGRVTMAGSRSGAEIGAFVFVPGSHSFADVRCLFGGAASRVVAPGARILPISESLGERGVLFALAATAYHAHSGSNRRQPDLVVGHGVLGRLIARIALAAGAEPPVVHEIDPVRRQGATGYKVIDPADDDRSDYRCICDVSGAPFLLDNLVSRLSPGGEIVLAGFYDQRLSFDFAPAFMREACIRVAAQWRPFDLVAVRDLVQSGRLSLDGLITHGEKADQAQNAYMTAFQEPSCLKMILDWRACQ